MVPFLSYFEALERSCLLAQPGGEEWMSDLTPLASQTVIAIGPECGWIASELNSFRQAGFADVCLSHAILRSEIALASALAQWELVSR